MTSANPHEPSQYSSPATVGTTAMQPLSKLFYFGLIIAGFVLTMPPVLFLVWVFNEGRGRDREVVPFLMIPAILPVMLFSAISIAILIYKMWAVIQQGGPPPRTTPGLAVLLLFIPCFNLYWVFPAYWGWTKDFNQYVAHRGIPAPRMPEGLALTFCIFQLFSIIPIIGLCLAMVNLVLLLIFMNSAIDGVNAVIAAGPKAMA